MPSIYNKRNWSRTGPPSKLEIAAQSARSLAEIKEEQIREDVIDEALEPEWIGNDLCLWRRAGFLIGASGEKLEDRWIAEAEDRDSCDGSQCAVDIRCRQRLEASPQ